MDNFILAFENKLTISNKKNLIKLKTTPHT